MSDNGETKISMRSIPQELTVGMKDKHIRFAFEYAWSDNKRQSAVIAGYSERSADNQGNRLGKNEKVQMVVQWLRERASELVEVDANYIVERLMLVVSEGIKPLPVMAPGGRDTGHTRMADPASSVRALELLGRYKSMWEGEARVETNVVVGVQTGASDDTMTEAQWSTLATKYLGNVTGHRHDENN